MIRAAILLVAGMFWGASLALGSLATMTTHHSDSRPTVQTFNDGFTASKQDDCQQGFQPACAWLARTGR